jgi:hypothetical protein
MIEFQWLRIMHKDQVYDLEESEETLYIKRKCTRVFMLLSPWLLPLPKE